MFSSSHQLVQFAALLYFFFHTFTLSQNTGIIKKIEDYEVIVGSTAIFHCTLNADHSLYHVNWLIEDKPVDLNSDSRFTKTDNHSLIIMNTIASDSGIYTCLASSSIDNTTTSYKLIIQDKPSPPELLGMTCHNKHAMIIWRSRENNYPPTLNYSIEYNTSFSPDTWSVASKYIPSTSKTYSVPLTPWTNFTFRVIAINSIGRSNPSTLSNVCSTQPDVPYKNPEKVTIFASGHSCYFVISWTPMPLIEHNGPDFVYRVYWKKDVPNQNWNFEVITDYTINELVIYNQQEYQSYKVKVVASNKVGDSKGNQIEVIGFLGTYSDKNRNGVINTLKWLFMMFVAVFFFFIILFIISSIFLLFTSNERANYDTLTRTSSDRRRNNRSLFCFLGYPYSSICTNKSEIEKDSTKGSAYSMADIDQRIEEIINEDNSFCDLMQTSTL